MLQIRQSMFETNSSSCDVFIYHPNQDVSVPKIIELNVDVYNTPLDHLFNDYHRWWTRGWDEDGDFVKLVDTFIEIGVQKVKCSDKEVVRLFNERKYNNNRHPFNNLELIRIRYILGGDVILDCIEDYLVTEENIKAQYGQDVEFYAIRLS